MSTRLMGARWLRRRRVGDATTHDKSPGNPSDRWKLPILAAICFVVLGPFVPVVSTSLASRKQVTNAGGLVMWPSEPTLDAYRVVLAGGVVSRAAVVSVAVTVVGTTLSLICTTLLAYSLSRPGSFGHRPLLLLVLFTLLFTPGIIPSYLIVKDLGMLNSYWSLIVPVLVNGFNVIIMRAFFMEIPSEVREAARIDGAGDLRLLAYIVLPLSKAILAVVGLFYAVAYWNSFFTALLYLQDASKWPLQLILRTYVVNQSALGSTQLDSLASASQPAQQSLEMAILVLALGPILCAYPFVQRYFTKGVITGAVKG